MVIRNLYTVTRDSQECDVIYVNSDEVAWFTPDGIGRIFYDSVEEAREDTGIEVTVYLERDPDD